MSGSPHDEGPLLGYVFQVFELLFGNLQMVSTALKPELLAGV